MALGLVLLGILGTPQGAFAWPAKYTSCSSCHAPASETDGTIVTAINGVIGTSVGATPGSTFEIDFKSNNVTNPASYVGVGFEVAVPAGWGVSAGTSNSPGITGWNSVWDIAASGSWAGASKAPVTDPYSTATQFPNSPEGRTIIFNGTGWDTGSRDAAYDDGTSGDLDGVADNMGGDVTISIPGGTSNGTYYVVVGGYGHEGSTRAGVIQTVTVTVSGGGDSTPPTPGTVTVTPQYTTYVPGTFTISTHFTDPDSAVSSCEYTVNGVSWTAGTVSGSGPYTCSATPAAQANGSNLTVNMRATSSGGTGTATSISRTVDAAAPSTGNDAPAGWQSSNVTVTLTPTDGTGSGLASTLYCVDNTNIRSPATSGTSVSVTQTAGTAGTQYVRFRSADNLSNTEGVQSATVQIDLAAPVDGILTVNPGNSQNSLSWTVASDSGSGLRSSNTYDVRFVTGGSPPADCASGTSIYTGIATSYNHTSLTNGQPYSYRVCAYDNIDNVSTGATGSGTPAAVCTQYDPTVTILEANKQITAGSGTAVYTVQVTNNDTVDCSDTTFSLSVNDGNATDFATSALGTGSLLVSPGASNTTTLTVTAVGSPTNAAVNLTSVTSAAGGGHAQITSSNVTTLINLARTATLNYNIGDSVHVEYRTDTRFDGGGLLTISTADVSAIVNSAAMLEVQQGSQWIYTYDWDTAGQSADTYMVQITDGGDGNPSPTVSLVLANPATQLNFFADSGYTTPTDVFAQGATVYVEVLVPVAETGVLASEIDGSYGGASVTVNNVTQTGKIFRYDFTADFATAGLANGDWGYLYWQGNVNSGLSLHRPIQRNDAGCGSCTYTDPTVAIVTSNQTITSDGGTANYTINVTNNDTVACGPTSFDLVASDTNSTNFDPSTFSLDPFTVSPGGTDSTTLVVKVKVGQSNGVTNDSYFYTASDVNHGQSANSGTVTTNLAVADVTAPTVDAFTISATSTALAVPVTTFTASDAVGVTGYKITETATQPGAGDAGWTGTAPATYTVGGDGSYTLYAWAKDASDNVSTSLSAPVSVDATAPTVTDFTAPATSTSQTVSITQFLASDSIGVTGYKITESATPPGSGDAGWTGTAPASYTVASDGSKTLYPWAKDALGNVSAVFGSPATVLVDTAAPSVSSTDPVNSATGVALDADVTINFNEPVDCGTVNATNIVSDSPGWTYVGTSCISSSGNQAVFNTSGQAYLTTYNVSVSSAVQDPAGNPLSPAPQNFSYTTMAEACTRNTPDVSIDTANQNATVDGDWLVYTVSITNNDVGGCGNTTFNLTAVDSNATDFDPSTFDSATITLAPLGSGSRNLTVKAKSGSLNGASNDTYFYTEADGNHAQSANSGTATTIIAVPCNIAPTASILTANQQIVSDGGNAAYTVQVQNDNALACGATAFDLVAVDDNGSAFSTPSTFAADPLSVNPGGATNSTTLTVTAQVGATNGAVDNSYFYTALSGTIPASSNSNTVTTTLNRPCVRNAPSFSFGANQNISIDGSGSYTLTVINNDVDCVGSNTFTFGINSEVESNAGSFTTPSSFSVPSVNLASGSSTSTPTFDVLASGTGADGDTLTSTIKISSANHLDVTTVPVTTLKQFDPLVHSSFSTGSTKHAGDGGWGVAGARYGEFTCDTCHTPTTTNIKRVRTIITTPNTTKGILPGDGTTVAFLDSIAPTADFGNDSDAPRASSNRICEVCHTYDATQTVGTNKHAFDQQVDSSHENGNDCTSCHKHSAGFSASGGSCDSCHGYPPDPADAYGYQASEGKGAHAKHVSHLAALSGVTLDPNNDSFGDVNVAVVCGACHDMNAATHEMSGGTRNINFNGSAVFQFGPIAPAYNGVQGTPSATTPKTCSNINCHFQNTPWWE